MVETRGSQRLVYITLFVAIATLVTFLRFLPVGSYGLSGGFDLARDLPAATTGLTFGLFPAPDIMLCLTLAWVLRRPDLLPAPLIVGYFLLEDILFLRPVGLWALLVLGATEFLRARTPALRGLNVWVEFMVITGLMTALFLANRAVLAIVMTPLPPLGLSLMHLLGTILIYPAVVAVSHFVFKLRKPATGEVDDLGQKL